MTGILIYLFPATMDMILSSVLFMSTVSAAQQGLSAGTVANLITTWAVVYMVMAFLLGRVVSPRNSAALILFSCAGTAALSITFACTQDIRTLYALVAAEGVAMAVFFVPFQVFMKVVGEGRAKSINYSVGLYTFSWSFGYAAGPFVAALMWHYVGWQGSHLLNAGAAVLVGFLTWTVKHAAEGAVPAGAAEAPAADSALVPRIPTALKTQAPSSQGGYRAADYSRMPDLAWMGWVFSGLGCLAARLILGVFPSSGAAHHVSKIEQGLALFILSAVQAFVGLGLGRFRWWMYRPGPIFAAGLFGITGLTIFSLARSAGLFYVAAACFGIYSGMFFFYLVFHSLVHPERSGRYIAVNEATVGLMSLAGPFLGGRIADAYSLRASYLIVAGLLLAAVSAQSAIHAAYRRRRSVLPATA